MEILVWSKVLNVLKHAKKWGCLQILDPIPWLIIFPYSLTAKCLCPNTGYPPKLQVLMEKSVIILWIWDIPNVLRQTECFHPGWIRLRVQKASCRKSKGKRDSSCWVKIAQLEPPKDKDFLRVLIDDPAYLINNKYQSLGVWKIVMRMVNWKGFPKILSFFLQQFASDSWRRFTRQRLNPPVCSRDASAFGSDDFSWHELGGEPINKGNMKHKGGDNYQRKLLAINQIGKTCPEIGIGYPPPPSKSPHSSSLK